MKQPNTVYQVAQKLKTLKKVYIHDLKRGMNNPMQRIKELRDTHLWNIKTVYEGVKDGKQIYHYKLIKEGKMPQKFN